MIVSSVVGNPEVPKVVCTDDVSNGVVSIVDTTSEVSSDGVFLEDGGRVVLLGVASIVDAKEVAPGKETVLETSIMVKSVVVLGVVENSLVMTSPEVVGLSLDDIVSTVVVISSVVSSPVVDFSLDTSNGVLTVAGITVVPSVLEPPVVLAGVVSIVDTIEGVSAGKPLVDPLTVVNSGVVSTLVEISVDSISSEVVDPSLDNPNVGVLTVAAIPVVSARVVPRVVSIDVVSNVVASTVDTEIEVFSYRVTVLKVIGVVGDFGVSTVVISSVVVLAPVVDLPLDTSEVIVVMVEGTTVISSVVGTKVVLFVLSSVCVSDWVTVLVTSGMVGDGDVLNAVVISGVLSVVVENFPFVTSAVVVGFSLDNSLVGISVAVEITVLSSVVGTTEVLMILANVVVSDGVVAIVLDVVLPTVDGAKEVVADGEAVLETP